MTILLDTNVLVYAVGAEHPLRAPARKLIDAIARRRVDATTTPLVLQEFLHVRGRRLGRADACAQALAFHRLLAPLVPIDDGHVARAVEIFGAARLGAADSLLASSAIALGRTLVTADGAFDAVPGLVRRDIAGALADLAAVGGALGV